MKTLFYPKLAAGNIKRNAKSYLPYILTCIFTVAMYYIMGSLASNPGLMYMASGSRTAMQVMKFGSYVVAIFACIFLFYTNSFLMKNRKKELGLFNILGMEKRHLADMHPQS